MKRSMAPLLTCSLVLAACGGGSGGITPTGNDPGSGSSGLTITAGNGAKATNAAWQSANQSAGMIGLVGAGGTVNNPGNLNKVHGAVSSKTVLGALNSVPFGPITEPCLVSGTVTISGDLADPITGTLTAGDIINVSADMCDDGAGEILNGDMSMVVDDISGDFLGGLYNLTMSMTLTDLSATSASDTITSNGDVTVTLDTTQSPFVLAAVTGTSLTTDTNTSTETLSNFQTTQTVDGTVQNNPFTLSSAGSLDTTELAGTVEYSTPVTFMGDNFGYPHTGELLVTGAGSSALLIAVDASNVRIEIDSDGDSTIDETLTMTWDELANS